MTTPLTPEDSGRLAALSLPPTRRRTVRDVVAIEGVGIHSGAPCTVKLTPAEAGSGILLQRPGREKVRAHIDLANPEASDRRTVLVAPSGERFEQIEHLMAALVACHVTDVLVEQTGPEVPFLGGGSREYMDSIRSAGIQALEGDIPVLTVTHPTTFTDGDVQFSAMPHDGLLLSCFVEFPGTVVGNDGFALEITEESFYQEASAARTFALASDIEKLRAAGLIRGGNLQNAVVFDHERYHNPALNYPNEVVRHKIIDLLGDLALTGCVLRGHFWAWRSGHRSHLRFAQHLMKEFG